MILNVVAFFFLVSRARVVSSAGLIGKGQEPKRGLPSSPRQLAKKTAAPTAQTGPTTPAPTSPPTDSPPGCAVGAPGGPRIAMAWISDQFANFDVQWNWGVECTTPSDPSDPSLSNQFKCCHDWLVDSFAGINVVSLAFLKPTEILDPSTCTTCDSLGVRIGMPGAISYFKAAMSLVFVSIGGATYTSFWEEVLANNQTAGVFAAKVADVATRYGVGIEIDYEESANPLLEGLEHFVRTYRLLIPFNEGPNPAPQSFLTIDFGQGAQFMGPIANWVAHNAFDPDPTKRLLNWANAMVSGGRESRVVDLVSRWSQHVHGYSTLQTFPIAPAYLVGSLWSSGRDVQESCVSSNSPTLLDPLLLNYVKNVEPCINHCGDCKAALTALPAGSQYTKGLLGYAFWMCGNIAPRQVNTCPLNVTIDVYGTLYDGDGDCSIGFGAAAGSNGYHILSDVNWTSRKY